MAEEKHAMVVYKKAVDMKADDVDKPYDPVEHNQFAKKIPGEGVG